MNSISASPTQHMQPIKQEKLQQRVLQLEAELKQEKEARSSLLQNQPLYTEIVAYAKKMECFAKEVVQFSSWVGSNGKLLQKRDFSFPPSSSSSFDNEELEPGEVRDPHSSIPILTCRTSTDVEVSPPHSTVDVELLKQRALASIRQGTSTTDRIRSVSNIIQKQLGDVDEVSLHVVMRCYANETGIHHPLNEEDMKNLVDTDLFYCSPRDSTYFISNKISSLPPLLRCDDEDDVIILSSDDEPVIPIPGYNIPLQRHRAQKRHVSPPADITTHVRRPPALRVIIKQDQATPFRNCREFNANSNCASNDCQDTHSCVNCSAFTHGRLTCPLLEGQSKNNH